MKISFPDGVWPTMITPFTETGVIDYTAVDRLIDWYIANGVAGLFAVCQSSEMFYLSLEERVSLARYIKEKVAGRVPVIASGHVSYDPKDQIAELNAIAQTGVDAVILITNRLAREDESDDIYLERLEYLVRHLPEELPLGFYECPFPYKRILTPKIINFCTKSGRFYFLKDTSCDIENIREKIGLLRGSNMKLYNANTATLLDSMELGAAGYSGVMANFHPQLYDWLLRNWKTRPVESTELQEILTMCSYIEMKNYPANAKCSLNLNGVDMTTVSRKGDQQKFSATAITEIRQLNHLSAELFKRLNQ